MLQPEKPESWILTDPSRFVVRDNNVVCGTHTPHRRTAPLSETCSGNRGSGPSSRFALATDLVSNRVW